MHKKIIIILLLSLTLGACASVQHSARCTTDYECYQMYGY